LKYLFSDNAFYLHIFNVIIINFRGTKKQSSGQNVAAEDISAPDDAGLDCAIVDKQGR
jgi:hypothetical protein